MTEPTKPSAQIIADSISPYGDRLTTIECVMHRFVLSELNTHRVFSRNSASSRAIPVKKQLARVINDPALPLVWPLERPGMQGGEELSQEAQGRAQRHWLLARDSAVQEVRSLTGLDQDDNPGTLIEPLHKSLANRLLEPFMWHTVIISSTEWENFFGLRCNPLAQPEIQAVAYAMRDAFNGSTPAPIGLGDWHLPYISPEEFWSGLKFGDLKKISAARCARVSYLTHDGVRDIDKDLELADRLMSADPPHASPLEHVATPCREHWGDDASWHDGNFRGWDQFRHLYKGEK